MPALLKVYDKIIVDSVEMSLPGLGPDIYGLRRYRQVQDLEVRFPHGAPSLVAAKRLTVRGDVRFGRGVVVEGDAVIEHAGPAPLFLADGARIGPNG